jgi:hypothetical protein
LLLNEKRITFSALYFIISRDIPTLLVEGERKRDRNESKWKGKVNKERGEKTVLVEGISLRHISFGFWARLQKLQRYQCSYHYHYWAGNKFIIFSPIPSS